MRIAEGFHKSALTNLPPYVYLKYINLKEVCYQSNYTGIPTIATSARVGL